MVNKESLLWRYATKKYDTEKKVSDELVEQIMEAARLAPSSFGLEPWKFIVISNPALREQLRPAAFGQPQVTDASHLVVFATRKTIDEAYVDAFIARIAKDQGVSVLDLAGYKDMIMGSIAGRNSSEILAWNQKQVYIPLGFALAAAADLRVDSSPMEGFNPAQFDSILGLEEYTSTAILALGYRSPDDAFAKHPKTRFPAEEVITHK